MVVVAFVVCCSLSSCFLFAVACLLFVVFVVCFCVLFVFVLVVIAVYFFLVVYRLLISFPLFAALLGNWLSDVLLRDLHCLLKLPVFLLLFVVVCC